MPLNSPDLKDFTPTGRSARAGSSNLDALIKVVEFGVSEQGPRDTQGVSNYIISEYSQEIWPFIESGRYQKTFDKIKDLG